MKMTKMSNLQTLLLDILKHIYLFLKNISPSQHASKNASPGLYVLQKALIILKPNTFFEFMLKYLFLKTIYKY